MCALDVSILHPVSTINNIFQNRSDGVGIFSCFYFWVGEGGCS